MEELWRTLKIGDRVRVVSWPPDVERELLHDDTARFYDWLIETRAVLQISEIDKLGLPWGAIRRTVNGVQTYEAVIVNHGGLEVVRKRRGRKRPPRGGKA